MVYFKTTNRDLKSLMLPINTLVKECRLNFTSEGINCRAVNPTNTAMIVVDYPKEIFKEYSIADTQIPTIKRNTTMGLEFESLNRKIKYNEPKAILDISTVTATNAIGVETSMMIKSDGFSDKINLIDPSSIRKEPKIPELKLNAVFTIPTKRFLKILNKSKYRGNKNKNSYSTSYIKFATQNGKFITETFKDDIHPTTSETVIETQESAKGYFDADELLKITKIIKSKDISIEMGVDYPIKIKFDILEKGKAEFMLAPRVESE